MVNNADFVNTLQRIEKRIQGSGFTFDSDLRDYFLIRGETSVKARLKLVRLHSPSSTDVLNKASPDALLVISGASQKAAKAAAGVNHILVPDGGFRIVAPGVALIHGADVRDETSTPRQVKFAGRTGVVAETLLLAGRVNWSVHRLAAASNVSPGLVVRVVQRLERAGLMTASGSGPEKTRTLSNPRALAELWSEEEGPPQRSIRGFLYNSSTERIAHSLLRFCPDGAVGGVLAANVYKPILTRVPPPVRIWIPELYAEDNLKGSGFEQTDEGANIELVRSKNDPWLVHIASDSIRRISPWRAWLEVSSARGRTKELADGLLLDLEERWHGDH